MLLTTQSEPTSPLPHSHADPRAWLSPPPPPPTIRKIKRAIAVAKMNGWILALGAALSWMIAVFSWQSAIAAVPLTVLAIGEFRGASRLAKLDLRAPWQLALNQIALAVLVPAYCAWQIIAAISNPALIPAELQNTGDPAVDSMVALAKPLAIGFYALVGGLTLLACGLNAWYYQSRGKVIQQALAMRGPGQPEPVAARIA